MFINGRAVKAIVIYGKQGEKELEVCNDNALFRGRNIYDEEVESNSDIIDLKDVDYKQARQVNKAKREGKAFYNDTTLYLPEEEIANIETRETYDEFNEGDKSFRTVTTLEFKNIKVKSRSYDHEYKKPTDEYVQSYFHLSKIEDVIDRQKNKAHKAYLNKKLKQGYKYISYEPKEVEASKIEIYSYVTRHEKTQERLEFEELSNELSKICDRWHECHTKELLKKYKLVRR